MARTIAGLPLFLASFVVLLALLPASNEIKISEFEVPDAVRDDETAHLLCRYELGTGESETSVIVKWYWRPVDAPQENTKLIYQRVGKYNPQVLKEGIVAKPGDSIDLAAVDPDDSGIYECEVATVVAEERKHDTLIVYTEGSGPKLNISLVEDGDDEDDEQDVLVTCDATDVAPEPELAITLNGQPVKVVSWLSAPSNGFYNVSANATLTQDSVEGLEIRCEMFYPDDNITHPAYYDFTTYSADGESPAPASEEPPLPADLLDDDKVDTTTESSDEPDAASNHLFSPALLLATLIPWFFYF